jgi:uncharacterized membrane protein
MIALGSAAVFPLASHFGIASSRRRDVLVRCLGGRGYLGSYSLVTLVAFAGLVAAYRRAPLDVVWIAPDALKLALAPIMVPAFVLAVAGRTTPNPTIVGAERLFDRPDCVRGILRVTRNPFLWGSGVVGSGSRDRGWRHRGILTFGSVAVLGLAGTVVLGGRKSRRYAIEWARFASLGSNVPFAAIVGGRQRFAPGEIGWWRLVLAAVLFGAAVAGHRSGLWCSPVADRGML